MNKEKLIRLPRQTLNTSKRTFRNLFFVAVVILVILPFWETFQDILTRLVMSVQLYRVLQNYIVPYEIKIVSTLLFLLGFHTRAGAAFIQWQTAQGLNQVIYIIWNCVGWQTFILFIITLATGLSGKHTFSSKIEAFFIGVLGTYILNILRITIVIIVYMLFGKLVGTIFHDYFSTLFSLFWLFFYWWLSYEYVLVEKQPTA